MIKLVYILPDVEGGVASVVYNLISNTISEQYNNTVILIETDKTNPFKRNIPNAKTLKISFNKKESLFSKCKKIAQLIPKEAIIISNDGGIEIDAIKYFKLENPVVYIIHGDFNYYYKIIKTKHQYIDTFISVSQYVADKSNSLLNKVGSTKKAIPIHFPVPLIQRTEEKLNSIIRIIFVGSLIKRKGVHLFPQFIEKLCQTNIPFEFTIIGQGELLKTVEEIEKKYKQVQYIGAKPHEEVLRHLKNHHILFLPSLSEGLPVSIVEAMKTGLVTITSDLKSGIPEIINKNTGYKIEPGNISGYLKAITELYNNSDLFYKLKENAIEFANKNFNPQIQTNQYINEFKKCLYNKRKHLNYSKTDALVAHLTDRYRLFLTNHFNSIKRT